MLAPIRARPLLSDDSLKGYLMFNSLNPKRLTKSAVMASTALIGHARDKAVRFTRNEDGVAAIEFAFIAPAMLFMYFGLLEVSLTVGADRKISHATNVAADLVTQVTTVDKTDMEDVLEATLAVMNIKPSNRGKVTIEILSYQMLADPGNTRQRIGYARLGPAIQKGGPATYDPAAIKPRFISTASGTVIARVNYKHSMVTAEYFDEIVLHETFLLRPRASAAVPFEEGVAKHNTFMCTAAADLTVSCIASTT